MPDHVALSVRAAEDLRQRILSGGLPPGERLPTEPTLMEELGVGRSTVREAVRILEREGLVRVRQGSGTYVAQPDRPGLLAAAIGCPERPQIDEVRRMLEPELARLAAIRRTPDQAREILRLGQLREKLRAESQIDALIEADLSLHRAIAVAANNPILQDLFDAFILVLRRLVTTALKDGDTEQSSNLHTKLATAVAIGDPEAAEAAIREILKG